MAVHRRDTRCLEGHLKQDVQHGDLLRLIPTGQKAELLFWRFKESDAFGRDFCCQNSLDAECGVIA